MAAATMTEVSLMRTSLHSGTGARLRLRYGWPHYVGDRPEPQTAKDLEVTWGMPCSDIGKFLRWLWKQPGWFWEGPVPEDHLCYKQFGLDYQVTNCFLGGQLLLTSSREGITTMQERLLRGTWMYTFPDAVTAWWERSGYRTVCK